MFQPPFPRALRAFLISSRLTPRVSKPLLLGCGALLLAGGAVAVRAVSPGVAPLPLVTGKALTPVGNQTGVGSFPANAILSPDGRFVLVTDAGAREFLSVLRADNGQLVSRLDWNGPSPLGKNKQQALYFGLVCAAPQNGETPVYASRGAEGTVSVLSLASDGTLRDTGRLLGAPVAGAPVGSLSDKPGALTPGDSAVQPAARAFIAGLALSADGTRLFAADNRADAKNGMQGALLLIDTRTGALESKTDLPGFPLAVVASRSGQVYVTSEARGAVCVVDGASGKLLRQIPTGTQPTAMAFDRAQGRLFVSNAGSDTLSIIDTRSQRLIQTVLLRPDTARGLAGATPLGLSPSPDGTRLYVALADMNAIAVVDVRRARLAGFLPAGWYPTCALASPDGARLFIANAKGVRNRNPNDKPVAGIASRPQYIQNIIEGTLGTLDLGAARDLRTSTAQVLANNRLSTRRPFLANPGIKHIFYIIKENRTYDQVLGDLPGGNGDPSLTLFGQNVTPNLHALAARFALLDNFYCSAEVSGDGWNWSTGGMASEYTARNVAHSYGRRERAYDFEGSNGGIAVDRAGLPDVARPPGGYLWDLCAANRASFRNYGFFCDDLKLPRTLAEEGTSGLENSPTKRALVGHSDADFRQFDLTYPDSEAWQVLGMAPPPKQKTLYGSHGDPSRVSAWKREFAGFVRGGNLPALSMIRLGRDHTSGTTPGFSSPRAMVADNDYAVGQLVETVSRSPYWKSSAIVVVEDDAQNGFDHVDAHRSTAYVISPFVERGTRDHRFGNTDSALKTIECLLGLPPMTQYDAIAQPLRVFGRAPSNAEPFAAIPPAREVLGEVNTTNSPGAQESALILNPLREESAPDERLNEILWRSLKGTAPPARRTSLWARAPKEGEADED